MKKRSLLQRVIIILLVTIAAIYIVIGPRRKPTRQDFTWAGVKKSLSENINLGLDLRGGSHLVMQVQTDEYLKRLTEENGAAAQQAAKDGGLPVKDWRTEAATKNYRIILDTGDASKNKQVLEAVQKKVDLSSWTQAESGSLLTWTLPDAQQRLLSQQAVDQSLRIIDSRINAFGVTEPTLQTHGAPGSNQILLQMPGINDPERIKSLLVGESRLELVHVISPPSPASVQKYATREEAMASIGGQESATRKVLAYSERDEPTSATGQTDPNQPKPKSFVVVEYPPVISGSELRDAQAVTSRAGSNDYQIQFSLKPTGAQKFGDWTGRSINEYMGVVLENEVKSIAYIKSQITDSGEISGRFTKQSADDLALTLRSGALPARITYIEERTVGPSLGADSIKAGVTASAAGLIFVILFMVIYYKGAGVNAVVALLLNVILTVAALIIFKATLTLPGIAGLILSIGMAVDSNVLIFERIREEWQTGKTVPSAVEQGFARAFATIIDTHVTTIVACLFLFVFGTGPIRGFAVTLVLGLLANLFSAVYVSRTIFMWVLGRKKHVESLSI
ncbi:MAG TPA: protein translocase subunit SecD [Pyrinomonadaceae bacterium]|jgi:preprotein translocase subunit SecD